MTLAIHQWQWLGLSKSATMKKTGDNLMGTFRTYPGSCGRRIDHKMNGRPVIIKSNNSFPSSFNLRIQFLLNVLNLRIS